MGTSAEGLMSFIGTKMLIEPWFHVHILASLGLVIGVLALSIGASLIWPEREKAPELVRMESEHTGSIFGTVRRKK